MNQFLITYFIDLLFSYLFKCLLCLSHFYLHICVFSLVDVCHWQNYQNLSDAERKHDYETQEGDGKCDETLNGWYRFRGAAGTKMLTTCPPLHRCDAAYPIWLSGGHPTVAEGKVTRNVCINKLPCCKESFSIHVKNCSSYYIYKLGKPTGCPARYCSTD